SIGIFDDASVRPTNHPIWCRMDVHPVLDWLKAPKKNEHRKNQERQPGYEGSSRGIPMDLWSSRATGYAWNSASRLHGRTRSTILFEAPDCFWFPELQEPHRHQQ